MGLDPDARLKPHAPYRVRGRSAQERPTNYRALLREQLDRAALDDIRLALNLSQPLGNARFYTKIEQMTGQRREARPRGRPRVKPEADGTALPGQTRLNLLEYWAWPFFSFKSLHHHGRRTHSLDFPPEIVFCGILTGA